LLGVVLMVLSATAQAQCENMRVIVRNSVYAIVGLDAFCTEFNKMKADLAGMKSELSIAQRENAMLRARLAAVSPQSHRQNVAWTVPLADASKNEQRSR
jgi:hypothetical protein